MPESAWSQVGALPPLGTGDSPRPGRSHPEARTEDMDAADLARLEQWTNRHLGSPSPAEASRGLGTTTSHEAMDAVAARPAANQDEPPAAVKMEAGLRVCPRCGKPVHMSATVCRNCGEPVPKR